MVTRRVAGSNAALSMFILYLAAFSSFWLKCTRSGATALPGEWQATQVPLRISVAAALGSRLPLKNVCWVNQSEPGLAAWQVRQDSRLGLDFQLSPCGVVGRAAVWHFVQLRRSCGNPTSE
jgi:hypothetical protein